MFNSMVYASQQAKAVWFRVEGKGTFQISAGLKEYALKMIDKGCRDFVVDLDRCEIMDSTFMGTLAGIALRLRDFGSGRLSVIRGNARNVQLLENLGLDHLFGFDLPKDLESSQPEELTSGPDEAHPLPAESGEPPHTTMLDAHEALVTAEPENEKKFRDVIELLQQETSTDESNA